MTNKDESNEYIFIENEDGVDEKYEIFYEFETDDNRYILLVAADIPEEEEEAEVYAFKYIEEGEFVRLETIESDEEWEMIEDVFNTLDQEW
jgi:uncharacterized protein YrzB (UPF0473 family)